MMRIDFVLPWTIIHTSVLVFGGSKEEDVGTTKAQELGHEPERPLEKVKRVLRTEGLAEWIIQSMINYQASTTRVEDNLDLMKWVNSLEGPSDDGQGRFDLDTSIAQQLTGLQLVKTNMVLNIIISYPNPVLDSIHAKCKRGL